MKKHFYIEYNKYGMISCNSFDGPEKNGHAFLQFATLEQLNAFLEKKVTKKFVSSKIISTFATANKQSGICPDGGIGRRAGLKHQWSNPCRFDPGSGYFLKPQ